jgi:amidase
VSSDVIELDRVSINPARNRRDKGVMASEKLNAVVYPTMPQRPHRVHRNGQPVTMSFLGTAFSEGRLIELGYSFEQATHARRLPVNTPALKDEKIRVPSS